MLRKSRDPACQRCEANVPRYEFIVPEICKVTGEAPFGGTIGRLVTGFPVCRPEADSDRYGVHRAATDVGCVQTGSRWMDTCQRAGARVTTNAIKPARRARERERERGGEEGERFR